VDRLQVSKDTLQTKEIDVYTRDTQLVTMQIGVTYDVPDAAVYNLLYQTGGAGNQDIDRNLTAVINDRVRTVISKYGIAQVAGPEREQVMTSVKAIISQTLFDIFGLHVVDTQIVKFAPSKVYAENVERAVRIRAGQLAASLERDKARIEAEKIQIQATA